MGAGVLGCDRAAADTVIAKARAPRKGVRASLAFATDASSFET